MSWKTNEPVADPSMGRLSDLLDDPLEDTPCASARYEDRGRIASGGMGTVRRVFDRSLRREAAVKVLHPGLASRPSQVQRFVEEAQITGQLEHPNIVPIHELGADDDGSHYFCMKLVEGRTLAELVADAGGRRLHPDHLGELLQVFLKICEAVSFAHHHGVIHRDLKPANIMVGRFGQVYLMDWGLAHLTSTEAAETSIQLARSGRASELDLPGTVVGTPRYMAPEQVQGLHDEIDERTDVFALGATLYHLLTGDGPFRESNYFKLLIEVEECVIPPPEEVVTDGHVPPGLGQIAMRALAREQADRYPDVETMRRDVERFLRGAWHLPTRSFAAGEVIVREGEEGDAAYILVSGRCRVFGEPADASSERRLLREMGPGEVFGETAVFSRRERTATVEAATEVDVMVVTAEALESGLGLQSWMGSFVKALSDRFCEVDAEVRELRREVSTLRGEP